LATAEGETQIGELGLGRARRVTVLSCMASATALSRDCTSRPPATDFTVSPWRAIGQAAREQQAQILLCCTIAIASSVAFGAMMISVKISVMARAASASSVPFTATMPPEAEVWSQASALR